MTTRTLLAGLLVLLAGAAGCMSRRAYPIADPHRDLVPYLGSASPEEMERLFATRVALREPVAAGLAWILDVGATDDASVPEAERTALLRELADGLSRAPFSAVAVLPTAPSTRGRDAAGGDADLSALRAAAARFQKDVLVVVSTQRNEYVDWNPLAVTYLALVPRFFVPGDSLAVYVSASACALDVRTGIFLACADGQGEASRALELPYERERRLRRLGAAALGEAFEAIPAGLLNGVRGRLAG